MIFKLPSPTQELIMPISNPNNVKLYIKREDLIHPIVSGNKWRKLKYNFEYVKKKKHQTILTYGGAFSNHLHALSWLANKNQIKSIGLVRGEKESKNNATLSFCLKNNMSLYFLDRKTYRKLKYSEKIIKSIEMKFGKTYLIPEGGFNIFGIRGCEEIMKEVNQYFNIICCPIGSGCTSVGIINSIQKNQKYLGFSSFKQRDFIKNDIKKHLSRKSDWDVNSEYHFGGFGKWNDELIDFIHFFKKTYNIQLDPVYTGKLFFGLFDMISKKQFPNESRILAIHTGGIQGMQDVEK